MQSDYLALEDRISFPNPLRAVAGAFGLMVTTVGGLAAKHLLQSSTSPSGGPTPFVPKEGINTVLVHPGRPGTLQLLAPNLMRTANCIFAYAKQDLAQLEKEGVTATDGWVYGMQVMPEHRFPIATGNAGDVLKGRLLCWALDSFHDQLNVIDGMMGYDPKATDPLVGRAVVPVVFEDGSAVPAYIYLQARGRLDDAGLDVLFRNARTARGFQTDKPVSDEILKQIITLASLGPTSANCCPARFVIVKSDQAKKKLLSSGSLMDSNVEKARSAPAVIIVAWDTEFYEKMPRLFPQAPAKDWFVGNPEPEGTRSAALQTAYVIMAARSLGLDTLPMAGFDKAKVDSAFLAKTKYKSLLLIAVGYGKKELLYPRNPRLDFDEVAELI
eukprot:gb/GEZN01006863.1/.p1 GENE.gb/GEZN01006863.1/~~gb/GEZN01006863.1/.p1  ORF type:complete len:411 (+),score=55.77 gb/GEZN01006863.1/:79-1233(+)